MKKQLLLLGAVTSIFVIFAAASLKVNAQEPPSFETSQSNQTIAQNCGRSQKYLQEKTRIFDRRARVDRLQAYLYILQQLEDLVQRLERNNQPKAQELRQRLTALTSSVNSFKNTYESYDDMREKLAGLDGCAKKPDEFRSLLAETRRQRSLVAQSVSSLQAAIGTDIIAELEALYQTLLITGQSGAVNE